MVRARDLQRVVGRVTAAVDRLSGGRLETAAGSVRARWRGLVDRASARSAACLVCGAGGSRFGEIGGTDYFRCPACGHLFVDAARREQFTHAFYNSPGYKACEATWPQRERIALFRQLVDAASAHLGRAPHTLLDYGAGSLDLAEKAALAPFATFYDPHYSHHPRIVSQLGDTRFDVAVVSEVLEHVFDPIAILRDLRRRADLCLATTLLNDVHFVLGYLCPEGGHVSIFSQESMRRAAEAAGWRHQLVFWPGQSEYYYHLLTARA